MGLHPETPAMLNHLRERTAEALTRMEAGEDPERVMAGLDAQAGEGDSGDDGAGDRGL